MPQICSWRHGRDTYIQNGSPCYCSRIWRLSQKQRITGTRWTTKRTDSTLHIEVLFDWQEGYQVARNIVIGL